MGGIAGIFHSQVDKPVDPARVEAMIDVLAHRGPDGSGVWTAPGVGLGHNRLSTSDPTDPSAQPMLTADGRVAISFDGEIHNHQELRAELKELGHVFRTRSDTEVILAAWRQMGADALKRLDGMFALALYDAELETLFLARDRLGVKPLFWSVLSDGALVFASELKGLLAHPLLRRSASLQAVEDYFALGYVPDDACIVEGVSKLPAGHALLIRRGKPVPRPERWWNLDFSSPKSRPIKSLEEELIVRLQEAVRSRMIADVPVGAALSGGVGSSAIVAVMAADSRRAVETCTIAFDDRDHAETAHADGVASLFHTRHRVRTIDAADFSQVDRLAEALDEPFADVGALAALNVAELAREGFKVSLLGGGDPVLAGHRHHSSYLGAERMRRWIMRPLGGALSRDASLHPLFQALGRESGETYARAIGVTPPEIRASIYRPDFQRRLQGHRAEDRYERIFNDAPANDLLSRAQYADLMIGLPGETLTRVDRTSMAVGLEARMPLLDHRLVEFATRLPARMRLGRGNGQWLMRRALREWLPAEILDQRRTRPASPVGTWLRGPLAGEVAAIARSAVLAETGWFEAAVIAHLAEDHLRGRIDHGRLIWQLIMLERSLQRLFGLGSGAVSRSDRPAPHRPDRTPRRNRVHQAVR